MKAFFAGAMLGAAWLVLVGGAAGCGTAPTASAPTLDRREAAATVPPPKFRDCPESQFRVTTRRRSLLFTDAAASSGEVATPGQRVMILARDPAGCHLEVVTENGRRGWLSSGDIVSMDASRASVEIAKNAVWGCWTG